MTPSLVRHYLAKPSPFVYSESVKTCPINTTINHSTACILAQLQSLLREQHAEAYLVGSIVRNLLAGHAKADVDIAINGSVSAIGQQLADQLNAHYVMLDNTHGIARLLPRVEETWQIDIATLQGSLEQDLLRRDFSINALAINISEMHLAEDQLNAAVLDAGSGLEDIQNKTLRAVSPQIFRDDPIRLLRGVRLSSELGFNIEERTATIMQRDHAMITRAAGERIHDELLRLFNYTDTYQAVDFMNRLGLLTAIIPELAPTRELEQPPEHTWDVFHHSVRSIEALDFICHRSGWEFSKTDVLENIPWGETIQSYFSTAVSSSATNRVLTKLAALLHDIAKPQTRIINEFGRVRFYGHPQQGAPIAASILERLRFSHHEIKFIETIVRHHLRPVQMTENEAQPTKRAIYRYCRDLEEAGIANLYFSLADHLATRGPNLERENWDWHVSVVRHIVDAYDKGPSPAKLIPLLDGNDLQSELNLKQGKQIGQLLEELSEAQAAGEINTRQQGLDYAQKLLTEGIPNHNTLGKVKYFFKLP
ncbi:MAG: HD domain-containing protein [Dehalococcoidia bacterium]|nr:HD domain-containing protein [Dehalococcoidia bacterium]